MERRDFGTGPPTIYKIDKIHENITQHLIDTALIDRVYQCGVIMTYLFAPRDRYWRARDTHFGAQRLPTIQPVVCHHAGNVKIKLRK